MFNTIVGAEAVGAGAGAASRYGSGSDQKCGSLRLRLRNTGSLSKIPFHSELSIFYYQITQ
jgi:hypothetical protein